MTTNSKFAELAALHPDTNGGDHSRVTELMAALRTRRSVCACGCQAALRSGRKKYLDLMHYQAHRWGRAVRALTATGLLLSAFSLQPSAFAGEVTLAWDASPSPAVTNYVLYAHTNSLSATNLASATVKVNAGTNLTALVENLRPPVTWYFVATAVAGGVQSDPSNQLIVQVPPPPANARVVAVQFGITLTNLTDVGFFRLRIPAPGQ